MLCHANAIRQGTVTRLLAPTPLLPLSRPTAKQRSPTSLSSHIRAMAEGRAAAVHAEHFLLRALVRVRVPAACCACATAPPHTLFARAPEKGQLRANGPRKSSGARMCSFPNKCDVSMAAIGRHATISRNLREWPRALTNELVDQTTGRQMQFALCFFHSAGTDAGNTRRRGRSMRKIRLAYPRRVQPGVLLHEGGHARAGAPLCAQPAP